MTRRNVPERMQSFLTRRKQLLAEIRRMQHNYWKLESATCKYIRKQLSRAFPGHNYSVRSTHFALIEYENTPYYYLNSVDSCCPNTAGEWFDGELSLVEPPVPYKKLCSFLQKLEGKLGCIIAVIHAHAVVTADRYNEEIK